MSYNLGQNKCDYYKTTPRPISMMEKMARFGCSAISSMIRGEALFYFSFYPVQDSSSSVLAGPIQRKKHTL